MARISAAKSFAIALALAVGAPSAAAQKRPAGATVADYFAELEKAGLIDVDTGSRDTLVVELRAAESLLRAGAYNDAAVALYSIVESPRYEGLTDFVEFQNAQYYLGVALARSGAYDAAVEYFLETMRRGPGTLYFAPAHRQVVDIALTTQRPKAILAKLQSLELEEPLPAGPLGERAYLEARVAYDLGDFAKAEARLSTISRKSRLYSSALYLRGVIRTRRGDFRDAADSLCEIVDTADDDRYSFVVDERYFTIKDLARLGLARIAHETSHYDSAYYHYFQIPEDSDRLPDALFEAAWSMYQKRELGTARDLAQDFVKQFPSSPLVPEARLLAGYIELADCKFEDAQKHYDALAADLQPIVDEIASISRNPERRSSLFDRALERWRAERQAPDERTAKAPTSKLDRVLALLRFDAEFVQAHEAVSGLRRAAGDAPHVLQAWRKLAKRLASTKVGATSAEKTAEETESVDAQLLVEDVRRLQDDLVRMRAELRRGARSGELPKDTAEAESQRLQELEGELSALEAKALAAAEATASASADKSPAGLGPMVKSDMAAASALADDSRELLARLEQTADELSRKSLTALYAETRRVLDKAKLGKIDAVIGQKRKLEIEVQDLASGRFPPELHGQLWEQGLIGDDEEFWPFEGEYWADEYEGWR